MAGITDHARALVMLVEASEFLFEKVVLAKRVLANEVVNIKGVIVLSLIESLFRLALLVILLHYFEVSILRMSKLWHPFIVPPSHPYIT